MKRFAAWQTCLIFAIGAIVSVVVRDIVGGPDPIKVVAQRVEAKAQGHAARQSQPRLDAIDCEIERLDRRQAQARQDAMDREDARFDAWRAAQRR
ncbi:MAG: hypothetical protein ACREXK_01835 [Gammaproteobacteria bacterium]